MEVSDMSNETFDLDMHILSLLEKEPFFAAISRHVGKVASRSIPTAGVKVSSEGYYEMIYNPDFFGKMETKHRIGVLKHEFYHLVFEHVTSRLPDAEDGSGVKKMNKRWNIATDLAINSYLVDELPNDPAIIQPCLAGEGPFKDLPPKMTSEWYYANLPNKGGRDENGEGEGMGDPMDDHSGWGDGEIPEDVKQLAKQRLKEMMKDAADDANKKGWGTIPADMQAEIKNRIKTHVDWRSILRYFIKTSQRANKTSTVRKINKRFPYIHAGKRVERRASMAIAIDQSGSVSDEMLVKFFSALDDLSKLATFTVIPFDTRVGRDKIYEWKRGTRHATERVMCGGTCFDAPTKYVNDEGEFDGLIVLTDLQAPKPIACTVPRMWMTDEDNAHSPYFKTNERVIVID
jgi:predicted metal-dependent peptidase